LKMEQIECSETSDNINQTPGKHPKVSTLDTEHGESLKSRIIHIYKSFGVKGLTFPQFFESFCLSPEKGKIYFVCNSAVLFLGMSIYSLRLNPVNLFLKTSP
jgi:hypothetical protein